MTRLGKNIYIRANTAQIREVFTNLVFNAVEAMPTGGTLTIEAARQGDKALCVFRDTGMGISPEIIDRIFDPFFTTKGSGSGLGLSISFAIIEKHGGQMTEKAPRERARLFT